MIILSGDPSKMLEWREFANKIGLTIIAEIYSDYYGTEDKVEGIGQDGVLRGSVHHLERGESVAERPMIKTLSKFLVEGKI